MSKRKMLIVITAVTLGIAGAISSAQAGSKDDDGYGEGGIKIGPLGQTFGGPPTGEISASAPLTTKQVHGKGAAGKRD